MTDQTDVVVVGLGPGGGHVAGAPAEAGLDVIGIEAGLVGGDCTYWGCIPSNMMIRAGNVLAEAGRVPWPAGGRKAVADWGRVAERIRSEATGDWNDQPAADRLETKGVCLVRGTGRLAGPRRVIAGDRTFQARRGIVLATGSRPRIPPIPGVEGTPYWTNRDAIETEEIPTSMLVLGGGAIGVELAQVFARFGCAVTVMEGRDRLLAQEEPQAGELAAQVLRAEGVTVRTGARAAQLQHYGTTFEALLEGGLEPLRADRLLVATGRRTDLAALAVDTVGIDPAAPAVPTDGQMRVGEGVWAVGDIGRGAFTHVSMYQAQIAVRDILGEPGPDADYRALPRVTFTDPELGAMGSPSGRPATRACGSARAWRRSPRPRAAWSTGRATKGSSSSSRTPTAASWSARPPQAPQRRGPVRPERRRPHRGPHRPPQAHDLHLSDLPPDRGSRSPEPPMTTSIFKKPVASSPTTAATAATT